MGRKATVTPRGDGGHSEFALAIGAYLNRIQADSGLSGRAIAERSNRAHSWWADVLNGTKTITTNDINYIATDMLGITPYRFVENARRLAEGQPVPVLQFKDVGTHADDFEIVPKAKTPVPPVKRAAKKGTLKADQ